MNKKKLIFSLIGGVIATFLSFKLFFYIASLGYVSIGDSYCKFGPIPAKYAIFTVSFKSNYTGQLTLIDKKGKQLSNADYSVLLDGRPVGTSFKAPGKRIIRISIRGNSNKVAGRTYIRVKGGGPFITHYYFRHHSNPFVYYIIAILLGCIFVAILWFVFLQRQIYPRFGTFRKQVLLEKNGHVVFQGKVDFTHSIKVVFINKSIKQSFMERIFKGNIVSFINSEFDEPLIFTPNKDRKKANVNGVGYMITPNPILQNGVATITHSQKKLIISLN